MLNGELPFKQEESKLMLEAEKKRQWKLNSDDMAEEPTKELVSVMKQMLEPDPEVRITMARLVEHPWVAYEVKTAKNFFSKNKSAISGGSGKSDKGKSQSNKAKSNQTKSQVN